MSFKRDPDIERLWFEARLVEVDDLGQPFTSPHAAVFHHGEPIAYYSAYNGTPGAALTAARGSIPGRVNGLCGIACEPDHPCTLFKGPEDP